MMIMMSTFHRILMLNNICHANKIIMNLDGLHLKGITPLFDFGSMEEKLTQNFQIIISHLKNVEALRDKYNVLQADNFSIRQTAREISSRLEKIESGVRQSVDAAVNEVKGEMMGIRAELHSLRPELDRLQYNTERMDAVERQSKIVGNSVKQFDLIKKDIQAMQERTMLSVENYRDELNRKTLTMQQEIEAKDKELIRMDAEVSRLRQKIENVRTETPKINQSKGQQPIDDLFKQKTLQKINDINQKLVDYSLRDETEGIRQGLKNIKKILDNKMDMSQYDRMLDFINQEIRRSITQHEQKEHSKQLMVQQKGSQEQDQVQPSISQSLQEYHETTPTNVVREVKQDPNELSYEGLQKSPNRRRSYLKQSSTRDKAVEEVKLLQSLSSRLALLEGEIQEIRKQNQQILRGQDEGMREKAESLVRLTDKISTNRSNQDMTLPYIRGRTDQSMEVGERHRRRDSRGNISLTNTQIKEDKMSKDVEKKISDLRTEVHYYFKQLEKSMNFKESKEDSRKRMEQLIDKFEEVKKLMSKKIDTQTVKKNLLFLQNKVNQVIAIMIANEGQAEATMARRGWVCLSCDKGIQKFEGKSGEHRPSGYFQGSASPPKASGFINLQRSQQRYKNLLEKQNDT